ncbi:MAG: acetate--CoA ligase [Actinobacteria bacterium]|nr:acetate--CoA ligase [Actinomycetota bacterium]
MGESYETLESFLQEQRLFPPSAAFKKDAVATAEIYEKGKDPEAFWESMASELHWFKPWDRVLEWNLPFAKWFINGKINASYNCVDRHIQGPFRDKTAIIWEGEPGEERTLTYSDLYQEVNRFANALKKLGVKKGDRVTIYMPMIPEIVVAMLSCARIGASHSVVFGGFSAEALRGRINDAEAKVLITADGGYRRGKVYPMKQATDEILKDTPTIESVIVVRRVGETLQMAMKEGRDYWYHDVVDAAEDYCEPEQMDAEDMLFLLHSSGTTGKPKGIVHTTGGYLTGVYATFKYIFDYKPEDIFWCTADIGWITGHSYIAYGPLLNGATQVMYEGAPDYPDRGRWWSIIEKHKVSILYTAPTAIRSFMRWGIQWLEKYNLSSLCLLGTVGEPINPEAWIWYYKYVGSERCPIVDTWWQTETGQIIITPLPGITTCKPGSATHPFPGTEAEVVDEQGSPVKPGGSGYLVLTKPWPAMLRTLYKDEKRYIETYWGRFPGKYLTGDGGKLDEDGYFWILGRVDDIIKVAGHRISTIEVESALVDHKAVAESAVIGIPHEIKGEAIAAFVILKEGYEGVPEMQKELAAHVRKEIGPVATPETTIFVGELPKTRSGKIMRRLLRDIATGRALGDISTLSEPGVIKELKQKYESEEKE